MARKKGRDKTETIKQRAIYVYLPSIEMAEEWKKRAEKAGISISKFVIEHVENSLRQEEGEDFEKMSYHIGDAIDINVKGERQFGGYG